MLRKIIRINEEKCNGCGLCAKACHENAIGIKNNKAVLLRDDYCDGLGDCLPVCPTDAISFEERDTLEYDEAAVKANQAAQKKVSSLSSWPVQIKLVHPMAEFLSGADLLIAADCTAYAYSDFHNRFMDGKVTLIGCPKLDAVDYTEKLTQIFKSNKINSITVVRMEVPCCFGLEAAVKDAIRESGKNIPFCVDIVSTEGNVLS